MNTPTSIGRITATLFWGALAPALLLLGCAGPKEFQGFSYDPEGATVTTTKPIQPQHRRTIGVADQGVWISNEFEGARMNDFYQVDHSLFRVVIEPENHPINNSPWYAFKIWSDIPQSIQLELDYEHGEHRYIPELSHDRSRWTTIDGSSYQPDTTAGTALLTLDIGPDTLWVSAQELITGSVMESWIERIADRPSVRHRIVGYSHLKNPIHRLTITDAAPSDHRGVVIITSRQHPPEVTGGLACQIFIDALSGESTLARQFRKHFEVIAYPFMNPDGVNNGHWRHNAGGVDLNRDWIAFNQPETRSVRRDLFRLKSDTLRTVYYGIDFHSTDENIFYPISREIKTFPDDFTYRWLDTLMAAYPGVDFTVEPFDTSSPITKNWIYRTFGADALTYEVLDTANRDSLKVITGTAAKLLMEMLLAERKNI
ncbi:MAG: M14 family metallopeptidase [Balneolaceae bacterium]|nr:M14 family metallopeptidase [Balneolaceae bacterium]